MENIVARIKSFIPATESTNELCALNNEGNLLIEELTQENNDIVNSRISCSYNQTTVVITDMVFSAIFFIYFLLTFHFNI